MAVKQLSKFSPEVRGIAKAYADSWISDFDKAVKIRNLEYRGKFTKPKTAVKQAEVIGGYNEFNPTSAAKLFNSKEVKAVRVGRESSVVAYIATKNPKKTIKLAKQIGADEYNVATGKGKYRSSYGKTPVVRVWWD